MKKLLVGTFLWLFTLGGVAVLPNNVLAQDAWFDDPKWWSDQDTTYNADVRWAWELTGDALINSIKTTINWVLWLLSLIALALCLYAGFLMMTSGWDSKKYEKGVWILKWAWIGLAIIALSWLIVSLIFRVINGSINWWWELTDTGEVSGWGAAW